MTEKTVTTAAPRKPLPTLDLIAFLGALILAPLVATLMTFYLVIPIGALFSGGPAFVVIGGPILFVTALYRPLTSKRCAVAAFATVGGALAVLAPFHLLVNGTEDLGVLLFFGICALIFAPFWGATFGWLYRSFASPRRTLTPVCR